GGGVGGFVKEVGGRMKVMGVETDEWWWMKEWVEGGKVVRVKEVGVFWEGSRWGYCWCRWKGMLW
ncbi:hypothetical protein, partial [Neisseria sicca]|uniref:hypothetical protein n=1 Tax=Neisseria sicca TaxID=490 RepID=UPI001C9A1D5C